MSEINQVEPSPDTITENDSQRVSPRKLWRWNLDPRRWNCWRNSGTARSASGSAGGASTAPGSVGAVSSTSESAQVVVDIERIWLIRNKGQPFPAGKGSWEVIHFAEEYWTERAEACARRLDAYRTNLASSTNQLIQLIGLYIVFQGVLLTTLDIIAARLTCKYYRFPLTLDIIATLCAVLSVALKFKEIRDFEKLEFTFNQELKHTESQLADLRKHLHEYDFRKDDRDIVKESSFTLYKLLFVEVAICGSAGVAMYLMHSGKCQ